MDCLFHGVAENFPLGLGDGLHGEQMDVYENFKLISKYFFIVYFTAFVSTLLAARNRPPNSIECGITRLRDVEWWGGAAVSWSAGWSPLQFPLAMAVNGEHVDG